MTALFADAFYFLALLNKSDKGHAPALQFRKSGLPLVTTSWVLTEVGDALCAVENRDLFLKLLNSLYEMPDAKIIPASEELFERGIELFRQRPDNFSEVAVKERGEIRVAISRQRRRELRRLFDRIARFTIPNRALDHRPARPGDEVTIHESVVDFQTVIE